MRITKLSGFACVMIVLSLTLSFVCGCQQKDPKVMVTPFVAKAPQPPSTTQPSGALKAEPCTAKYEQTMMSK